MSASDYMRDIDVRVFLAAAKHYRVWIVVRASNPAGKQYIGVTGFVPKRMDCKAKTAKYDVTLPGVPGTKKTAGLVVSLEIKGMERAFDDVTKARSEWLEFKPHCYFPEAGKPPLTYFPNGKLYSVQMNSAHERYGCILFSSSSVAAAASYIHSDYDLFGIVRQDDPTGNVRVVESRVAVEHLGDGVEIHREMPHTRSQLFFDVQHFLNHRMGVAMVLHGEQETFKDNVNEDLDVFCPDGTTIEAYGPAAVRRLYEVTFQGRKLYGPNANPKLFFGLWQRI